MPTAPKRPCRHPGCPNFCDTGQIYCKAHMEYSSEKQRRNAYQRGYNRKWQEARLRFLHFHPFCAECLKEGKYTKATVVDHIIPHRGNERLFWDENNWQSLCKPCHDKKTGHGL